MDSSISLSRVSRVAVSKPRSIVRLNILNGARKNGLCTLTGSSSRPARSILIPKFQDYETISANKLAEFSSD